MDSNPKSEVSASCHECKVGRGYRPMLDYVELCPKHAAAPALYEALAKIYRDYERTCNCELRHRNMLRQSGRVVR